MVCVVVTEHSKRINSLYIGRAGADELGLEPGKQYDISIDRIDDQDARGTLTSAYNLGGLAAMYRAYNLDAETEVEVFFSDGVISLSPPRHLIDQDETTEVRGRNGDEAQDDEQDGQRLRPDRSFTRAETVFRDQQLTHMHIERFAYGNVNNWSPKMEVDVYFAFGVLHEYTGYMYCCGTSRGLENELGYNANCSPDAILIDRTTREYLIAEFKMKSSAFLRANQQRENIDVLVCWEHDVEEARENELPPRIVHLQQVLRDAIEAREIQL